jgi:hypothetical protein
MKLEQRLALSVAVGLFALTGTRAANAAVIYDSGGFDNTSRFSSTFVSPAEPLVTGNLRDQDFVKQWMYSGPNTASTTTGSARVVTSGTDPVLSGTQSVRVDRTSGDNFWAPIFNVSPAPSSPTDTIQVVWDMNVLPTTTNPSKFGPFFGIDAYSSTGRLGGAGIDATTGEFLFEDPTVGFSAVNVNPITGVGFQPGPGWHHYMLDFDYTTQTYSAFVDNVELVSNETFFDPGQTQFTDADIASLQDVPSGFDNPTGTAYFDNYVVSSVPEPTGLGLLLAGGLLVSRRRCRI